jgi:hypothetical protein
VPEPPDIPQTLQSGEVMEPDITIVESDKGTLYEYRLNGHLYMIKVQPAVGAPYYLLDTNGDGVMDAQEDHPYSGGIPQWLILTWD